MKIVSGGQTGVDRAALDVALKLGVECGGWCPAGRLDEVGVIPNHYPVKELKHGGFKERTVQNVKDSDGTVIVYFERLEGGTKFTLECCQQLGRAHQLIDAAKTSPKTAAATIGDFVRQSKLCVLNIAGARQSEWADGYDFTFRALETFLGRL